MNKCKIERRILTSAEFCWILLYPVYLYTDASEIATGDEFGCHCVGLYVSISMSQIHACMCMHFARCMNRHMHSYSVFEHSGRAERLAS